MKLLLKISASLLLLFFIKPSLYASTRQFTDVPADSLYSPHIQRFLDQGVINGKLSCGQFTGLFKPSATINRAEFAKLTSVVRLLEVGNWGSLSPEALLKKVEKELIPYYSCKKLSCSEFSFTSPSTWGGYLFSCKDPNAGGVCQNIGNQEFPDVPGKDFSCYSKQEESKGTCSSQSTCHPWFSQYVYYAVNQGFVSGYQNGFFGPADSIKRIHALKMLLVNNGNILAKQDLRYQTLETRANQNKSHSPHCLKGAEAYILSNNLNSNQSNQADAENLLAYALLADRLHFFGNECQLFTNANKNTPQERADFLQQDLLRKEAPRYFALSTLHQNLRPNSTTDNTINSATQNTNTPFSQTYTPPTSSELLTEAKTHTTTNSSNNPTNTNKTSNPSSTTNSTSPSTALTGGLEGKDNATQNTNPTNTTNDSTKTTGSSSALSVSSATGASYLKAQKDHLRQKLNNGQLLKIDEYALLSEKGRCCQNKVLTHLNHQCSLINYSDYTISETSDYNFDTYNGPVWHQATSLVDSSICWIPLPDIVVGYEEDKEINVVVNVSVGKRILAANHPYSLSSVIQSAQGGLMDQVGRLKIIANLEIYIQNHTLSEAKDWGLTNKSPEQDAYKIVMNWYNQKLDRKAEIKASLDELYNQGRGSEVVHDWGQGFYDKDSSKRKRVGSWDYRVVREWFNNKRALMSRYDLFVDRLKMLEWFYSPGELVGMIFRLFEPENMWNYAAPETEQYQPYIGVGLNIKSCEEDSESYQCLRTKENMEALVNTGSCSLDGNIDGCWNGTPELLRVSDSKKPINTKHVFAGLSQKYYPKTSWTYDNVSGWAGGEIKLDEHARTNIGDIGAALLSAIQSDQFKQEYEKDESDNEVIQEILKFHYKKGLYDKYDLFANIDAYALMKMLNSDPSLLISEAFDIYYKTNNDYYNYRFSDYLEDELEIIFEDGELIDNKDSRDNLSKNIASFAFVAQVKDDWSEFFRDGDEDLFIKTYSTTFTDLFIDDLICLGLDEQGISTCLIGDVNSTIALKN